MNEIEDLKVSLKGLFEKSTDPEVMKQVDDVSKKIEGIEKINTDLNTKNTELQAEYKKALLNSAFPAKEEEKEMTDITDYVNALKEKGDK